MSDISDPDIARVKHWFTYYRPDAGEADKCDQLRAAGGALATQIVLLCPASADRTAAIRKVREAIHAAVASVVLGGR